MRNLEHYTEFLISKYLLLPTHDAVIFLNLHENTFDSPWRQICFNTLLVFWYNKSLVFWLLHYYLTQNNDGFRICDTTRVCWIYLKGNYRFFIIKFTCLGFQFPWPNVLTGCDILYYAVERLSRDIAIKLVISNLNHRPNVFSMMWIRLFSLTNFVFMA